jgi:hypothetical protein
MRHLFCCFLRVALVVASACAPAGAAVRAGFPLARPSVGPGAILTSAHQGQIFGFAIDSKGEHGILGDAGSAHGPPAMETFDPHTATIDKVVMTTTGQSDFLADGVFAGDAGLFTFEQVVGNGVKRSYPLLDPISRRQIASWNSPIADFGIKQAAQNFDTSVGLLYGIRLADRDLPVLVVGDVAQNTISNVLALDPNSFGLSNGPQVAQDTIDDRAIVVTSLSSGAAGGSPPVIFTIDLATGKAVSIREESCPGLANCGGANGAAFDSKKQIVASTNEIYPGVAFYNLRTNTENLVQLPGASVGQYNSATTVANDPVHHLFLVAQPESSIGSGSNIFVYDLTGNLLETLSGFNFTFANDIVTPIQIALDPKDRMGYVNGPAVNQLQRFTY